MSEILGDYAGYIAHAEGMIGVARSEIEHDGRLIGIFQANPALEAGR